MSKGEIIKKEETETAIEEKQTAQISDLGDGSVFVKKTEDGYIKAVKSNVTLSLEKGQIYEINKKYSITKAGFDHMNKVAGISIITPDTLKLPNGQFVVNPYPVVDPDTHSITKVWVKKVAIGLTPTGNLAMTSRTLLYDIRLYFIQDLVKKVRYSSAAGKICAYSTLSNQEKADGIFYEIEQGMGVYADPNNAEVLKAIETYIQNKLFAERKAQTICERNAMKSHPALSQGSYVKVDNQGKTSVPVFGWVSDFTKAQLNELKKRAETVADAQDNSNLLEDLEGSIDDRYESAEEEDIIISQADDEIGEVKTSEGNGEGHGEGQDHSTRNLDIAYEDFVAEYGALAVEKIVADNFSGRSYYDLDSLEKSVAINRLNKRSKKKGE